MKKIATLLFTCLCSLFVNAQSDGTLDPTFGTGGLVTTDNSNNNNDDGNDLLLMADKSMIVGGTSTVSGTDISLCSYKSSGILNASFGTGGKLLLDIDNGSNDYLNALALDSGQMIVGVGYSFIGPDEYIIVFRMGADGSLDNTFGTNGIVKLNPAVINIAYDVAIQTDHKIVLTGSVDDGLTPLKALIIRLNEDGSYDGSFGDAGVWEGSPDPAYDVETYSIALQADGKMLIGGYHNVNGDDQFAVGRILPGGSMDVSFGGGDGWIVKNLTTSTNDIIHSIAVQDDGRILMAGESNGQVAISRINSDGTDDAGFALNGTFIDPLLANDDVLYSVIIQPDEMILAAGDGSIDDNVDFLLLRLTTDGALDNNFGSGGIVYTNFNGSNDYAHSVLLQADNKIVAAGSAFSGYYTDFALARYGTGFTEISNHDVTPQIEVYPNPSDGNCIIRIAGMEDVKLLYEIKDLSGRKIISAAIPARRHDFLLNMKDQAAGMYVVELKDEWKQEIVAREKIVIR